MNAINPASYRNG